MRQWTGAIIGQVVVCRLVTDASVDWGHYWSGRSLSPGQPYANADKILFPANYVLKYLLQIGVDFVQASPWW